MDTSARQRLRKKESERGSEEPSLGKAPTTNDEGNCILIDGERWSLPPDYRSLQESNPNSSEYLEWDRANEKRIRERYGRITSEELEQVFEIQSKIKSKNPKISDREVVERARLIFLKENPGTFERSS